MKSVQPQTIMSRGYSGKRKFSQDKGSPAAEWFTCGELLLWADYNNWGFYWYFPLLVYSRHHLHPILWTRRIREGINVFSNLIFLDEVLVYLTFVHWDWYVWVEFGETREGHFRSVFTDVFLSQEKLQKSMYNKNLCFMATLLRGHLLFESQKICRIE